MVKNPSPPFCAFNSSSLVLATIAVAFLSAGRFHWNHAVPWSGQFSSLVAFTLAWVVQIWAMSANPSLSSAIRIQSERGHRLIIRAPCRFVRHPGDLVMAISMPATALSLGSLISLLPAILYSGLILWRSMGEDRLLRENLSRVGQLRTNGPPWPHSGHLVDSEEND
jgi:protein-S-isoprenylcysteine O-methyltransferase Ste14